MSERHIRESLSSQERSRREAYRHLVAIALNSARHYNGTEDAYAHLITSLEQVEAYVQPLGFTGDLRAQETEAALTYNDRHAREIDDLLSMAAESQRACLSLAREQKETLPYAYTNYSGVFLQPGTVEQPLTGEGKRAYEVRFDTIVNDFLTLLRHHKIFADDVIVTIGQQPPSTMMRQESYVKVEIPRIGKTVLLCNQVGEATFIIQGHVPDSVLSRYTKDDLQHNPEYPTRKVIRGEQWQAQLLAYLFQEDSWGEKDKREKPPRTKVDVKELVTTRERVIAEIHAQWTPEKWVAMLSVIGKSLSIVGKGGAALCTLFGVAGRVDLVLPRLQLGAAIWPESEVIRKAIELETRTPEQWCQAIKDAGWTPERWLQMGGGKKQQHPNTFFVDGKGFTAMTTIFNIAGNPLSQKLARLQIGILIWPDSALITKELQEEVKKKQIEQNLALRTIDQWRDAVVAEGWTPERWIMTKSREFTDVYIDGKGLDALASIFGTAHDPLDNTIRRLQLGLAIWPESEAIKKAIKIETRTPEQWRQAIKDAGWTPERWLMLGKKQGDIDSDAFEVDGYKIYALGTLFGMKGVFADHRLSRLQLGAAIWPDSEIIRTAVVKEEQLQAEEKVLETRTPEQWRQAIKDAGWTPEKWLMLGKKQGDIDSEAFEINGYKLASLGAIFGIKGSIARHLLPRLQLGAAIWPDSDLIRNALNKEMRTPDQWRGVIEAEGWTDTRWMAMRMIGGYEDPRKISIGGVNLRFLRSIFNTTGDPMNSNLARFQLGLAIWPDSEVIKKAIAEHVLRSK